MKIIVKLFGTLAQDVPGYQPLKGMDVHLPDGSSVEDLMAHLDIKETSGCFVTIDKAVAQKSHRLVDNSVVLIFQSLAGG